MEILSKYKKKAQWIIGGSSSLFFGLRGFSSQRLPYCALCLPLSTLMYAGGMWLAHAIVVAGHELGR